MKSISGFDNLGTIGGFFFIIFNDNLETISGFGSLGTIVRNFDISSNDNLTTIQGFGSLTEVGEFYIFNNAALETITGFGNFKTIVGEFYIVNNTLLTNAQFSGAFNNLESIAGNITVSGNDSGATNWTMPTGWGTAPELKWGTAGRSLSGANFSGLAQLNINALDPNS